MSESKTIQLTVAYDGTELCGYQRQVNGPTVQGYLEAALSKVCNEPITIYGSSRTDAGVHARGQLVAFQTTGRIPVDNLPRALIAHLPPYIVVKEAILLPADWTPKEYIKGKQYIYTIHNDMVQDPLSLRYQCHVRKPLSLETMQAAAQYLEGTHDFSTFRGHNTTPQDPVKTIFGIVLSKMGPTIQIHVLGDGFLYHMVRNLAGFLIDVGLGVYEVEAVSAILEAKDRSCIGKTAPAQGLCLEEVFLSEARIEEVLQQIRTESHRRRP